MTSYNLATRRSAIFAPAGGTSAPACGLGYLTVQAAAMLARGTLEAGAQSLDGGPLGTIAIDGRQIILGPPLMFTKKNIDQFDF